jgi:hypothetical protein
MVTKQEFGDGQLHVEWLVPTGPAESIWDRGNNGVFLLGSIEVQIFDSYDTKIYPDGQAAAIYAQTPPLVNACRKPGEWETYDILFTAPKFAESGELAAPARITMLHNGVLVHLNQEIYGNTPHAGLASYAGARRPPLPCPLPKPLDSAAVIEAGSLEAPLDVVCRTWGFRPGQRPSGCQEQSYERRLAGKRWFFGECHARRVFGTSRGFPSCSAATVVPSVGTLATPTTDLAFATYARRDREPCRVYRFTLSVEEHRANVYDSR